tara:strand:+ start:1264 stop:2007 length:744 start_codon:yes stop_codon:yes gene_type:complete
MLSVLQSKPKLQLHPYPHVVVDNALPEQLYSELESQWPTDKLLTTTPYDNGICYRLKADEMLKPNVVSALWKEFTEYHTSKDFYNEVSDLFGDYLKDKDPTLGPRGWASKDTTVWTDCQTVMHKPITVSSRTPHIDNPREMYAGLLYMPYENDTSSGGDFQIYHAKNTVSKVDMAKGRHIYNEDLGSIAVTVPYKKNTFVMFANNSANAIHGVTPRTNATLHRRSVNIIAEYSRRSNKSMYSVQEIK